MHLEPPIMKLSESRCKLACELAARATARPALASVGFSAPTARRTPRVIDSSFRRARLRTSGKRLQCQQCAKCRDGERAAIGESGRS